MTHTLDISARIDRLEPGRALWRIVAAASFIVFFEVYDLALTAFLAPALRQAGIFQGGGHGAGHGLFGLNDLAAFAAATFAGLWLGTLAFSTLADMAGRRIIFVGSMLWYAPATVMMGFQTTATGVDLWRFIAAIGVGTQLVALDCYISEVVPKHFRGRARAVSDALVALAAPTCGILAWLLVGHTIAGIAGWTWLTMVPMIGLLASAWLQRALPESPRWLVARGREGEADAIVTRWENLSPPTVAPRSDSSEAIAPDLVAKAAKGAWDARSRARLRMMIAFHILQTIGFYGFSNWVPSIIAERGFNIKDSIGYATAIALAAPIAPLFFALFADRIERKTQIVIGAIAAAICGLAFAIQTQPAMLVMFGVMTSVGLSLMSYAYHVYQGEIFPTAIKARAVGIAYSFSRLSAIFSSVLIAIALKEGGVPFVFVLVGGALVGAALVIALAGPRSLDQSLEKIAATD